jgi:hypothetical protein
MSMVDQAASAMRQVRAGGQNLAILTGPAKMSQNRFF